MRHKVILTATLSGLILIGVLSTNIFSHCQIPCGIYDDEARFAAMLEDTVTLKKSVKLINELSAETPVNYNQIVRWINNKEVHADKIGDTIYQYFLAQRIKEGQKNYEAQLVATHKIIVLSMKVKQTVDPKVVDELEKAILDYQKLYTGKDPVTSLPNAAAAAGHGHDHSHSHGPDHQH